MATTIYRNQQHYGYPQPPPSPPMDETPKCSLPSISNLLVMAGAGSPTTEQPPQPYHSAHPTKPSTRPNSSHYASSRAHLPPTPPMSSDASFDGHNSPSARSVGPYYHESTPPLEDSHRHHQSVGPRASHQQAYSHPSAASQPPVVNTYYPSTPAAQSLPPSGLVYQKPLPQTYQPLPVAVSVTPSSGSNPWQHHHYISPSSAACFPQSQDRYICQTCNKAFSRPSSLRIHSHSHTGEKPFKCPHLGCGKAFSVRSNMKRHERGCHSYDGSVMGPMH